SDLCSSLSSWTRSQPGLPAVALLHPAPAQFAVVGPEHPIPASLRGEAILSCHLFPRMSAENMEVRWIRSQLSTVVHLYKNGKDQDGEQGLEYRGRTELLKDDIANGRVSLRIRDIRPSDDGQYTCVFQSGVSYEEALLELQVQGHNVCGEMNNFSLYGSFWSLHLFQPLLDVTLDPETAHPELVLSEDRKRVRHGNKRQDLPNTPARFDNCVCVLGAERFSGGRRYWEVEVGDKTEWAVGVCRESARRKGEVTPSSGNGYWVVWLRDGKYEACTSPPTPLPVSVRPSQVGIFLDYKAGEVSFYNVVDRSPLFTFTVTFSGTLRPYFSPGLSAGGTNAGISRQVYSPSPVGDTRTGVNGEVILNNSCISVRMTNARPVPGAELKAGASLGLSITQFPA
uniref:Butyrophilin subfamily 1 member A1 n=1 Tax=Pelusios castaneus TaxID=367368 RepID=A0A8C8S985_9SAUR